MSLWTPSGEHPVGDDPPTPAASGQRRTAGAGGVGGAGGAPEGGGPEFGGGSPGEEGDVDALRRQLADAPADVVVANHCYGLFELAAVYLSQAPPRLDQARLAIDALGALIDGLGERLGEAYQPLRDALAQIRIAFVQIAATSAPHGDDDGAAEG